MIKASIRFGKQVRELFIPEQVKTERAELKAAANEVIITARDPVAMRAMLNSVTKSMEIINKMEGIK